jgi:hypothetical protein
LKRSFQAFEISKAPWQRSIAPSRGEIFTLAIADDRPMMSFKELTLAPIDLNLVDKSLLTTEEADWLNAYHARVRETLRPILDAETNAWLSLAAGEI